jgi:hypothetical protein
MDFLEVALAPTLEEMPGWSSGMAARFDPHDNGGRRIRMVLSMFADRRKGPLPSHRSGRRGKTGGETIQCMRRSFGLALLLSLAAAGAAAVEAPRPMPRPAALDPALGPMPRPDPPPAGTDLQGDEQATASASDPPAGKQEAICGTDAIIGERLPAIDDEGACGIRRPVLISGVAGVALEPRPTLACPAARALRDWLEDVAKPAFEADGAPLVGLDIAAAYVCRNVNEAEDGELSEHARGRAVDIMRFRRSDGSYVSVLDGWPSPEHGDLLREVHEGACGIFSTTIGPDSDAFHEDHFHYDMAERRRPYCP